MPTPDAEPPFGRIEIEYHVSPQAFLTARAAYQEAVERGYQESFCCFLLAHTVIEHESVRVDRMGRDRMPDPTV